MLKWSRDACCDQMTSIKTAGTRSVDGIHTNVTRWNTLERRDGVVVNTLASNREVVGSIPGLTRQ